MGTLAVFLFLVQELPLSEPELKMQSETDACQSPGTIPLCTLGEKRYYFTFKELSMQCNCR